MPKATIDPAILERIGRECTHFNLRKAMRVLHDRYAQAMAPTGLEGTQFTVLAALQGMGATPLSDLAAFLVVDRTTLTRNLEPLERKGYVASQPGTDRRQRVLAITAAGTAVLAEAIEHWDRVQSEVVADLGHRRWSQLLGGLQGITAWRDPA